MKLTVNICLLLLSLPFLAQKSFQKGEGYAHLSYGAGYYTGLAISNYYDKVNTFGPVNLKYEHALTNKISGGLSFYYLTFHGEKDLSFSHTSPGGSVSYNNVVEHTDANFFGILYRFNLHFATTKRFDPYFGSGIGWIFGEMTSVSKNGGVNDPGSYKVYKTFPAAVELSIGVRSYLNDHLGFFIEAGVVESILQFGTTIKLYSLNKPDPTQEKDGYIDK